ncbi:MAG: RluA family pseudouridine synthase [Rickettsiales bacterium]|nr:MAG: RluA family pseudouridine synthase [Rickettsiales bacterium]
MNIETIKITSVQPIRLDRYLRRLYPSVTQGIIENYLRKGKIKVNDNKAKSSDRVSSQDQIIIHAGIFDGYKNIVKAKTFSPSVIALAEKIMEEYSIMLDERFIAINKPYGIAVQGGSNISLSIDDALSYLNQTGGTHYKLVHRLDRDTSGVLLIANSYENAAKITSSFKDRLIKKTYVAILGGSLNPDEGFVSNYIGKNNSEIYQVMLEQDGGKLAETSYVVIDKNKSLSLVEFYPITGRTHQLRVHSKHLGHSIIGDVKYGGPTHFRMLLHAKQLIIPQQIFGEEIILEAPLPTCFNIENIKPKN